MSSFDYYSVRKPVHPVEVFEIGLDAALSAAHCGRSSKFFTAEDLETYFQSDKSNSHKFRLISICQRNSLGPLEATKPMLDLIVSNHDIGPLFWEVASCFYSRNHRSADLDAVFCTPCTEISLGSITEVSYTIKYPEYKEKDGRWVIRQTGVYHRYDSTTSQSIFILLSPTPQSRAHLEAAKWLSISSYHSKIEAEPFWLHRLLFTAYFPAWRKYITTFENRFLPVAKDALATFIEEPLGLGHDTLTTLNSLETRFRQVPAILASTMDLLQDLCAVITSKSETEETKYGINCLKNQARYCKTYSQSATYLQQRAQSVAKLLSDTLLMRDQILAQEQNKNILKLNKSAVFITRLTLFYLPTSFIATFFGMNFFDLDTENSRIVGTSMIWIFFLSSFGLTAMTYLLYYWLMRRDGAMFHLPKIRMVPAWKVRDLKRQLKIGKKEVKEFHEGEA